jgi:glycine oxidase
VVGGGVIGLGIAWRTARRGLSVEVIDDSFGRGASWAAAGMLAPVTEVHYGEESLLRLNLESARRYPHFVAELEDLTGRDTGFRQTGTVAVAPDNDDLAALTELYEFQDRLGLRIERLRSREVRELEPALASSVRGGFFAPEDHRIDNRLLAEALEDACRKSGVTLTEGRARTIPTSGERVAGVALDDGARIAAGTVVLAAGCWTGTIDGVPPSVRSAIRPVKGQLLYLRGPEDPPFLGRNVRGLDVYVVPRHDGRIVIGATVEEMGFDTRVTAGAVYELLRDAYQLLPDLREFELAETVAGLRPGSADNAPLVGEAGVENLVIAAGHFRNGILLAPVTAEAVADLLVAGEAPDEILPFTPLRFASRGGA